MEQRRPGLDSIRGCILGGAIGDALGAPFEGLWSDSIPPAVELMAGYARFEGYPPGQYTDDTQLTLETIRSIVERRRIDCADIARRIFRLWPNSVIGPGGACTIAAMNYRRSLDWRACGAPAGSAGNGAAMRTAALGLFFNACLPSLPTVVANVSRITHHDPLAVAGGVAVARAAQELAVNPEVEPTDLATKVAASVRGLSGEFADVIAELPRLASLDDNATRVRICSSLNPAYEFGDRYIVTPYVVPTVLASLWVVMKRLESWTAGVATALRLGGDTDTVGSIVGALLGARLGVQAIPHHLQDTLVDGDEMLALCEPYESVLRHATAYTTDRGAGP